MPEKIESITLEQEARFPEWVAKWRAIGKSTEPADFERAKKAAQALYKSTDTKVPEILFAPSPKAAVELAAEVLHGKNATNEQKRELVPLSYGGSPAASWNAYVTFFRDVMDWENETLKDFKHGEELCLSCGWVLWHENVCVIVDRPKTIRFNDENELHCEDGPAIAYRDGWSLYMWNGTRIPAEWIEDKENVDVSVAITWENIEQRRCASEIIGWHIVLDKLDSVVVDEDGDPEIGTLLEVDLPDIGKEKFLKVLCGTGRTFALPVPPEMKTALEAQSWSWGIDEIDFMKPEIRT
jgi:hypothetical protein